MLPDIHRRLRDETRPDHARLESRVDIARRVATLQDRRALLSGFWRLHGEVEQAAAPWLADLPELDFAGRRRSPLLRGDLADLGLSPPPLAAGPVLASTAEALGLLYVVEGSSLGGQVIRRELAAAGDDFRGLSFLDPYGAETGARWRSFMAVLAARTAGAVDADACVAGARTGFRLAEQRLCEEAALA